MSVFNHEKKLIKIFFFINIRVVILNSCKNIFIQTCCALRNIDLHTKLIHSSIDC